MLFNTAVLLICALLSFVRFFFLSFFCQDLIKDNKLGHQGPQKNIDPSEEAKKEKHLCLADKMHLFGWGLHKWIHSISGRPKWEKYRNAEPIFGPNNTERKFSSLN